MLFAKSAASDLFALVSVLRRIEFLISSITGGPDHPMASFGRNQPCSEDIGFLKAVTLRSCNKAAWFDPLRSSDDATWTPASRWEADFSTPEIVVGVE